MNFSGLKKKKKKKKRKKKKKKGKKKKKKRKGREPKVFHNFACHRLLCWCDCLSEGPSGKEGLYLRVSSLFCLVPSGNEGLHLRVSSLVSRFVSLVVGGVALHLGLAQASFVRSFVLAGGACTLPGLFGFVTLVCVFSLWVPSAGFWPPFP